MKFNSMGVVITAMLLAIEVDPSAAQEPSTKQRLSVAKVVSTIPEGQQWGMGHYGIACVFPNPLVWGHGAHAIRVAGFEEPLRIALRRDGYEVIDTATDPFDRRESTNFAVGGTITAIKGDFCTSYFNQRAENGWATIDVDWQLYSMVDRRVVFTLHTSGTYKTDEQKAGGYLTILIEAMNDSVRKFTGADDFKRLVSTTLPDRKGAGLLPNGERLVLAGSLAAKPIKIADAIGGVVLVQSGGGHGSGVLISSDGYVLTDEHVVGAEKYVKIRWSDGLEGLGEVIRSDKRRDVALIKTDPRGRAPLPLRTQAPDPGETVYAIGAPEDPKLQSTVTRGVASSNRIIDGFSFIQSDVTVNPGNSGGPLLTEKGEVLGLTDWGLKTSDGATGLNFFTPIGDALAFLSLEQR